MNLKLPTIDVLQEVNFGDLSLTKTINNKNEVCPKINLYYHQERVFKENTNVNDDKLDDLYAALANFIFRVAAKGTITKIGFTYKITIKQIGIYVKDSFDYNDDPTQITSPTTWISQPLGFWSLDKYNVSTSKKDSTFLLIQNSHYQEYSKDTGFGQDFLVYSDAKIIEVNSSFSIPDYMLDSTAIFRR